MAGGGIITILYLKHVAGPNLEEERIRFKGGINIFVRHQSHHSVSDRNESPANVSSAK